MDCHIAVGRARSIVGGIVRLLRLLFATWSSLSAKCAVRLGKSEMPLDVKNVVDGGVRGKKFLG
jgi:hypothetical protein